MADDAIDRLDDARCVPPSIQKTGDFNEVTGFERIGRAGFHSHSDGAVLHVEKLAGHTVRHDSLCSQPMAPEGFRLKVRDCPQ